uniref:Uncharacterized protein n=1 Tax=Rhizophora mucronata TaxID=61149 RepID=A0A2P2IIJ3_RHIMU
MYVLGEAISQKPSRKGDCFLFLIAWKPWL